MNVNENECNMNERNNNNESVVSKTTIMYVCEQ